MRGSKNLIVLAVLGALSGAVAGCSTANFDPTDMLDFLDTKKKLPGERKPVFPEGVPGLEQGVPKDLYRGSRQQQIDQQNRRQLPPRRRRKNRRRRARNRRAGRSRPPRPQRRPRLPIPTRRRRRRAAPPRHRRRRSRPRSCAAAPPRRRPMPAQPQQAQPRAAAIRIPRAAAERQLLALNFAAVALTRPYLTGERILYVLHDCHYRPAQCRKVDAVQPAGRAKARAGR